MLEALCRVPAWATDPGGGPGRDVVVAVSFALGRNLAGSLFPWRAPAPEAAEARSRIAAAVSLAVPGVVEIDLDEADVVETAAAVERGWIDASSASSPHACRSILVAPGSSAVFSANDRDHLRIRCWAPGLDVPGALAAARAHDEALDGKLEWACDLERGYLAADGARLGACASLSAVVFIPAVLESGAFDRAARGLLAAGIQPNLKRDDWVRGPGEEELETLFGPGEDGDPWRDEDEKAEGAYPYVELRASSYPGETEDDFAGRFEVAVSKLAEAERKTRERMLNGKKLFLEDAAWRAAAVLRSARLLSEKEARRLVADLREGVACGVLAPQRGGDLAACDAMLCLVGEGSVRLQARRLGLPSDETSVEEVRAGLVRAAVPRYDS